MEGIAEQKARPKLTDFQTFWKIITLVCISIIAEAIIIWAATSDMAINWTYDTVFAPRTEAEFVADSAIIDEMNEIENMD